MRHPIDVIKAYLLACFPELGNPTKEVPQYDKLTDYAQCIVKNLEAEGYRILPEGQDVHQAQTDALKNMLGMFDTPATRLALGKQWDEFHDLAINSAKDALPEDPLLPPQSGDKKIQSPGHFLSTSEMPVSGTQKPILAFFDGNGNAINGKPGLAQWRIYTPDGQMTPGIREYPVDTPNMTNNFL
jgi:hypothetical protein